MATKNPSSQIAALLNQQAGPTTRDQVVTGTLASLTGATGGSTTGQNSAMTQQLATITEQLQQLQTINQTQINRMQENTQALAQNTSSKGQTGASTASSVGSTLESVLGIGLGLSPLISGLLSLFGGGGQSVPAPPTPFVKPLPIQLNGGFSASNGGTPFAVDSAQGGQPRPETSTAATQITVQVQALDSQSFLDHSNDIAMAVRQAMLETTVLNDVIRGA